MISRRSAAQKTRRSLIPILVITLGACASSKTPEERYSATQSVLEVVTVLRLHTDEDTYRFPPGRDFSGKNVYRASFTRLESLEHVYEEKFRSGHMNDVILFAKGRALERITEYELAIAHYQRVGKMDSPLAETSRRDASICSRLAQAAATRPETGSTAESALSIYADRIEALLALRKEVAGTHYSFVADEEIEQAEVERATHFALRSQSDPVFDRTALELLQTLVRNHSESKLYNRHLLRLADHYQDLSRRYALRYPPPSLKFDAATFEEYAIGAQRLYGIVSRQDGAIEKIEASHKLEAFLSFTLGVYSEKLPR